MGRRQTPQHGDHEHLRGEVKRQMEEELAGHALGVLDPHLGPHPVVRRVVGRPDGEVRPRVLAQLDGHRDKVAVLPQVEEHQRAGRVQPGAVQLHRGHVLEHGEVLEVEVAAPQFVLQRAAPP